MDNDLDAYPVTNQHVNSTIQNPVDMDILSTGTQTINGLAWTGEGSITKVEISTDNGETWSNVSLSHPKKENSYGWVPWSYQWSVIEKGEYTILSKATDSFGRTQPSPPLLEPKRLWIHCDRQSSGKSRIS